MLVGGGGTIGNVLLLKEDGFGMLSQVLTVFSLLNLSKSNLEKKK